MQNLPYFPNPSLNRPSRSRCLCGQRLYHREVVNGWSSRFDFYGLFGEIVTRCGCGRRLSGKLLDIVSYRNFR